jgi:hypothetical protein
LEGTEGTEITETEDIFERKRKGNKWDGRLGLPVDTV